MTEDEAKTKWCCGPPASATATYWHGQAPVETPMRCAGSACMAWRILNVERAYYKETGLPVPIGERYVPNTVNLVDEDYGYCGLAGQP